MRRLAIELEKLRRQNLETAQTGCAVADVSRRQFEPHRLDWAQTGLRQQLLWVEDRLRALRWRRGRRLKHLKRVAGTEAYGLCREQHLVSLKERELLLHAQRRILRQIGDAHAWLALGEDARVISPLYAPRTQWLPTGVGLVGPFILAHKAHDSGKFLVIENDLTRCLGIGDLTVVPASRPWVRPLVLEVKTSGEPREGATLGISVIALKFDVPVDAALYDDFCGTLGLQDPPEGARIREVEHQTQEMLSRGDMLLAATERHLVALPSQGSAPWRTIANVLHRAIREGQCFDIIERGVMILAVRADIPNAVVTAQELAERIYELGYSRKSSLASSTGFLEDDSWASLVPPIPLWPVSLAARSALMAGRLYFACIIHPDVWREAMRAEGLSMAEHHGEWAIRTESGVARFDAIEVAKLGLGIAFAGVSPREIARELAEAARLRAGPAASS